MMCCSEIRICLRYGLQALKKLKLLMTFLLLVITPLSCWAGVSDDILKGIQKIIDEDRIAYQMPGVQVSVIFPGEMVPHDFVSGMTTLEGSNLVNPKNLFQIGSQTKSFTAATLLLLEAKGLLSIEDPIDKWLPNLPTSWKPITIRQLLNHTSGIFNFTESEKWVATTIQDYFQKQWMPEELVSYVKEEPTYFAPGKGYHYSNTNFVLASMIVQAVTRVSMEDMLGELILKPLHLEDTHYIPTFYSEAILQRMAHGYSFQTLFPGEVKDVTYFNNSWGHGAGGVISTTHDTAIWLKKLLNGSLLPAKQMNEMLALVDNEEGKPLAHDDPKSGDGLGIGRDYVFGEEVWGHSGGTLGYNSIMGWMKCRDIVIAVAINDAKNISDEGSDSVRLVVDLISYLRKVDPSQQCSVSSNKNTMLKTHVFKGLSSNK